MLPGGYGRLGAFAGTGPGPGLSFDAWLTVIGPWRPFDESYFQQAVSQEAWDKHGRAAGDLVLSLIRTLAPWKGAVDAVAGAAPDVIDSLEQLYRAGRSNPLTSRPANGATTWPDSNPPGTPLPFFVDPDLAPFFRVSWTASAAALRRFIVVPREPLVSGAPTAGWTIVDLQAGPTGQATTDVNNSPAAILARLRGAPAATTNSTSPTPTTPAVSPPPPAPSSSPSVLVVGGLAALFVIGYAWTHRR